MPTPHIEAKSDEIARVVLMPGDPARAQWIAEKYLENPRLVSNVRRICCYTGTYQGQTVSVMASGMGMPSIGIYSYELFSRYGTEAIIRIGSAGAYTGDLKLRDVFLAQAAWTQSSFAREQNLDSSSWFYPSEHLNQVIMRASAADGIRPVCGALHSSDVFYHEAAADAELKKLVQENHLLCVEMESAALFLTIWPVLHWMRRPCICRKRSRKRGNEYNQTENQPFEGGYAGKRRGYVSDRDR